MDGYNSEASKWRDDNDCTLNGKPAKVIGWKERFAIVAMLDSGESYQWSWSAVNRIMEKDRKFNS